MSLLNLYSSANGDVVADSLEELNNILTDNYAEDGILVKKLSKRITCKGAMGIGWFTPDNLLGRLNDHIARVCEDRGFASRDHINSYRLYHDLVFVVVPQVKKKVEAHLTLSLIDSGTDLHSLTAIDEEVVLSSSMGPVIVIFHPHHSIPNNDRVVIQGKSSHRRIGLKYSVEFPQQDVSPDSDITYFAIGSDWKREMSFTPSYYQSQEPTIIPITPGYREHSALRNPRLLKAALKAGLNLSRHMDTQHKVAGDVDLATLQSEATDLSTVITAPKSTTPSAPPVRLNNKRASSPSPSVLSSDAVSSKLSPPSDPPESDQQKSIKDDKSRLLPRNTAGTKVFGNRSLKNSNTTKPAVYVSLSPSVSQKS